MDIRSLMQQAQKMKQQMEEVQVKLKDEEITGTAGGGLVKVIINGIGIVKKIEIDPSLLVVEEKEVLEDLIVAAFNDAKKRMDDNANSALGNITSGLQMPPGFGM